MTSASCASRKSSGPSRSCKPSTPLFSSPVPRPSSPVPRPSSLRTRAAGVAIRIPVQTPVFRPSQTPGDLKGAAAPWPMGKDSKGNRLRDRFPLAVSFADFFDGKEIGPPEATGQETKSQRQAANSQRPRGLPAAAGTRVWTRVVSLLRERPSFAARRKKAKTRPREPISRRFPWESLPDDQGGSAPIGFPTFG